MLSFKNYFIGGGKNIQWTQLQHNGPLFPKEYEKHNTPVIINNKKVILPILAEEYATMYAKYINSDYIKNPNFKKNFWIDFAPTLININVKSLDHIDFSLIITYLENENEKKKQITKEEKQKLKKQAQEEEEPYKYCIIDGNQQKVGNYKIEPPGIFLGRGLHPKSGCIKKRIYPEDIILNLDKKAPIPKPLNNHNWLKIINNQTVIWLATWKDNITNKNKYIMTSLESFFKAKSDEEKFNLAKKLKKKIIKIREHYENELLNTNIKQKQLATALYFIDNLALRVGGKKDSKEQADTVGVTSLRVEHITLYDDNSIKLDFLGKDSIRYCKKINVHTTVYTNLLLFIKNKSKKDLLFDLITPTLLNEYLNSFMPGLTAKVWRTYNASNLFQKELDKLISNNKMDLFTQQEEKIQYLISIFILANTHVALLCNHQKNINSNLDNILDKLNNKLKSLNEQKKKYTNKKTKNKEKIKTKKKKKKN